MRRVCGWNSHWNCSMLRFLCRVCTALEPVFRMWIVESENPDRIDRSSQRKRRRDESGFHALRFQRANDPFRGEARAESAGVYRARLCFTLCGEVHRVFKGGELSRRPEGRSQIWIRKARFCYRRSFIEYAQRPLGFAIVFR
jgi:hypothetical protein